ncbi:MAG: class I tRNA ligase family protein, partial [Candidatus Colwellbacteria bacterium]|nr:class I tRNA ligase family protein [Candidatus Colwellbacteria bacterium]
SNIAVAVNPKLTYTKYKVGNEYLWSYNPPPKLPKMDVHEKISGKKLVGLRYEPLYPSKEVDKLKSYRVVAADFVKTEEGTGMVHISPAFGEEDFNLLGNQQFPVTIDDVGRVAKGLPGAGKFIKEADKDISAELKSRNLLYLEEQIEHEYPFCWRCSTPLIYFARTSWFFEVSRLRKELLALNEKVNWIPDYLKHGRFGEWIKDAKDWAISRERYWGTPLPIWRCENCEAVKVVGSLDDLTKNAYNKNKFFILRHGEATHNVSDVIASGPEKNNHMSVLTEKGRKQIEAVAKKIKKKGADIIFSSPYKRALQTSKLISDLTKTKVIVDKRLREIDCGTFNWRKVSEHKKFFKEPIEEFTKNPPAGENLNEVKTRVAEFIKDINSQYRNKNIMIVSHGDPLWMLEAVSRSLKNEEALALSYIETGELKEISFKSLPFNEVGEVDMHRPYVDDISLECSKCRGQMKRIPDVADVWFDSGAMPFASAHYPFENKAFVEEQGGYPADYICEAVDQTRGWFYTLMAVAVLLGREAPPYRNVISLGLIRDKYGQKMSKSKGNVVEPMAIIQKYGVDVVRWYFYTVNPPAEPKDFDEQELAKALRRFFLILYNSYVFYESVGGKKVAPDVCKTKPAHIMDRWILARLNETIEAVTKNLESYEIGGSARLIEVLVDDLSRWHIRRSRRRPEMKDTLGFVLLEISKLVAPFAPFFGDALYQSLSPERQSVHLSQWPEAKKLLIDKELLKSMREVRSLAASALATRNSAGIKVRQPLRTLRIKGNKLGKEFEDILKEEVNVKEVIFDSKLKDAIELNTKITPELRREGMVREFVRAVQELRRSAGLMTKNRICLFVETGPIAKGALEGNLKLFMKEVGAKSVEFKKASKFDAEVETKIDSAPVWLGIKKA